MCTVQPSHHQEVEPPTYQHKHVRSRGRAPNILDPPPHLRLMNTCSWNCFVLLCDHAALNPLPKCSNTATELQLTLAGITNSGLDVLLVSIFIVWPNIL